MNMAHIRILVSMKIKRAPRIKCAPRIKHGASYRKKETHVETFHKEPKRLDSMPLRMICPCGGGQSCLIDRRWVGDWCHEDDVFRKKNIPLRRSCIQPYTVEQEHALKNDIETESLFWDNSHTWKV